MTLTQTFKITSLSVTKCHKVSQSSLKHSFRDDGGGGEWWWKPILVYSSGPTFELELDHILTLTLALSGTLSLTIRFHRTSRVVPQKFI